MDGDVIREGDAGYDAARQIWNASIDRRPALVARCASETDIVLAVAYAQEHQVAVAVRGGGHSVAGMGTCDGGLVIALSQMSEIEVDSASRRVRVGGGALLGAVDRACQPHGLATPAGVVSHTGVGGLALGGGVGWLTRKYGLTCDSLLEARVVTPAGEVLTASADSNPELLWGLRGGGGNFGVVSEFVFRCHEVPQVLPVGFGVWSIEDAPAVIGAYRELMPVAPDDAKGTIFFIRADSRLGVEAEHLGRPVVALVQPWIGEDFEAAERAFAPFLAAAPSILGGIRPMRWLDLQTMEDDISGHGKGNYTKGGYLDEISDELIDVMTEAARTMPGTECQLEVIPHGGAQLAVGENESAFSDRNKPYSFNVYSRWPLDDAADDYVGWTRGTYPPCAPSSDPGYTRISSLPTTARNTFWPPMGRKSTRGSRASSGSTIPTTCLPSTRTSCQRPTRLRWRSVIDDERSGGRPRRAYADGPFGQIHYAAAGAGAPLLLLHQTPRSWDEYSEIMRLLAPRRLAVAMDLPGMGASDPPPGEPTVENFADSALALLDALGLAEADVFGHHTGAFVAADLAARHPDRVRALILSAPSWVDDAYRAAHPDGGDLDVDNAEPTEDGAHLATLWRQRQAFYPAHRVDLLSAFLRDALRVRDPRAGHVACGRYELDRAITRVKCPVLLLGHDHDPHSFDDLQQFTRRMPDATVEIIEGGMVPLEFNAPRIAEAISGFLDRCPQDGVDVARRATPLNLPYTPKALITRETRGWLRRCRLHDRRSSMARMSTRVRVRRLIHTSLPPARFLPG